MTFLGIIIYKTLKIIKEKNIKNYQEFLQNLFNSKEKELKLTQKAINVLIYLFILITFFIMIAGFGAYMEENMGTPKIIRKYGACDNMHANLSKKKSRSN